MAQVSIYSLHRKGVLFIMRVINMLSRKHHIQIPKVSIRTISFRPGNFIYHLLYRLCGSVRAHQMTNDLPWITAYHRYDIEVFTGLCSFFSLRKPIQFIQLNNARMFCTAFALFNLDGPFLSSSSHLICSFREFFLRLGH